MAGPNLRAQDAFVVVLLIGCGSVPEHQKTKRGLAGEWSVRNTYRVWPGTFSLTIGETDEYFPDQRDEWRAGEIL